MNCKPGDLAVMVRFHPANLLTPEQRKAAFPHGLNYGSIVRCERLATHPINWADGVYRGPVWVIDKRVGTQSDGAPHHYFPDAWLRPIRDPGDDATDESAAWLPPVPSTKREPEAA